MIVEQPPEDPVVPIPPPNERSLRGGEHVLLWVGILLPGLVSPFFLIGYFVLGYRGGASSSLWMALLAVGWVALLLGCCWMGGWILAVKAGPSGRLRRASKSALLFLLGQIILTPTIGFGACFALVGLMDRV
ncbi:MAG: hypothetical protein ACQKBU_09105 [Verrucomicrobiales bacterium]